MKKRNYKRIFRPGTLMRIQGSNCVFMSLGLNPKNNRQIFSFNGMDIVERKPVTRTDGRARPANKWEQNTYWAVLKEITAKQDSLHIKEVWTPEAEQMIREKLMNDYIQANNMIDYASRADKPINGGLIKEKESVDSMIKVIKEALGIKD